MTSSAMGKTQRAVSELFSQSIAEAAGSGPTIVLLDEVETLAADRSKMSLEANPIDIHRATDAVLVQLDALAEQYPDLLFLATSNFPQAVDAAFTSRCDLVMQCPFRTGRRAPHPEGLPDRSWQDLPCYREVAGRRRFRPLCRRMCGTRWARHPQDGGQCSRQHPQTAMNPERVTVEDLLAAARAAKAGRISGGKSCMSTVASRTFKSTPERDAARTWTAIVDLLTQGKASEARSELLAVAGVAASVIADQAPKDASITVTCDGPRTRIYCLYDDDAVEGSDANEDALGFDPLKGDWRVSLPCLAEDLPGSRAPSRSTALASRRAISTRQCPATMTPRRRNPRRSSSIRKGFSGHDQRRRQHLHALRHLCGGQHPEEPERHHSS